MRKVQIHATVWTLIIAIPLTFVALLGVAYITENLTQIAAWIARSSRELSVGGRGLLVEFSARWPEIAGMVIGMIVLLTIFLFSQNANKSEVHKEN